MSILQLVAKCTPTEWQVPLELSPLPDQGSDRGLWVDESHKIVPYVESYKVVPSKVSQNRTGLGTKSAESDSCQCVTGI